MHETDKTAPPFETSQEEQLDDAGQRSQPSDVKVLVVDDSMSMRQTLEWILRKSYTVQSATDGLEGIEQYGAFAPEVILLDIIMPRADGFRVIEHIRQNMADQDTFIIMLTAEESQNFKLKALNLGANDFLYKPFDRTELLARLGVAERQVRLTRQLRTHMEQAQQELQLVAMLQSKLLPQRTPYFKGVQISSLYRPSGQASGDYFDYFQVNEGQVRVVMADVSGHGARAAFLMAIVRTLFRFTQTRFMPLTETLALVNNNLNQIIGKESDFVTAFAADIDFQHQTLSFVNCGHTPGMLHRPDGETLRLLPQTSLLGFFELEFRQEQVSFPHGAQLFLFTDGFYEWETEPGELLDLDDFWDLAVTTLAQEGDFLENLMLNLSSLTPTMPRFKDDLTALWIKMEETGD